MMDSPNNSKSSPQNRNENGKRKFQQKARGSPKKKAKLSAPTEHGAEQKSNVWTEFDEIERLCLPNYKFVPTPQSEIKPNYPDHYDVDKYLALRSAVERRHYRNANDLRKNIQTKSDESNWTDLKEHRLCNVQLRGQRCENPICSFKHEFRLPRKLRLCSDWRKGACANGNSCLHLHSEFPCRYHYLGMKSLKHDVKTCRYFHGGPLPKEYEDMFLNTIDSQKLPMFRQMYSKRLDELRGEVGATATVGDPTNVKRKEETISSHESTEQHTQEIDGRFLTVRNSAVEKSVKDVADKNVNGSDVCPQKDPYLSDVCPQNDPDVSDVCPQKDPDGSVVIPQNDPDLSAVCKRNDHDSSDDECSLYIAMD